MQIYPYSLIYARIKSSKMDSPKNLDGLISAGCPHPHDKLEINVIPYSYDVSIT